MNFLPMSCLYQAPSNCTVAAAAYAWPDGFRKVATNPDGREAPAAAGQDLSRRVAQRRRMEDDRRPVAAKRETGATRDPFSDFSG